MATAASPQFGTTIQVEIVPPFGPGVIVNPDLTPGVTQGRVDFAVTKGVGGSTPAVCSIRCYNLKKDSRDKAAGITKRAARSPAPVATASPSSIGPIASHSC